VGYATIPARINEETGAADGTLSSAFRSAIEKDLANTGVPGAQIVVRREGELLWSACAGQLSFVSQEDFQSRSGTANVRREDRFVIASVTKLVVACVALSLAECGELDLDCPVAWWLPDLPNSDRITVRMLLGHRSGLREYFKDRWVRQRLKEDPLRSWNRREVLEAVKRLGSEKEPGQRFAYRNTNYIAVGEILESCTGKTVRRLVEDHVSRPLGLRTLSFSQKSSSGGRLAAPHTRLFGRIFDPLKRTGGQIPTDAIGEVWTDGGIVASAEDIAALTDALFGGRALRPETVEVMSTAPVSSPNGVRKMLQIVSPGVAESAYGLGVAIEKREETYTLGHDGMYLGWSAVTTFEPRSRVTMTILTNLLNLPVPAHRLQKALRSVLDGKS
jgi:D-alanyl-D-alanine carboxypeptidase